MRRDIASALATKRAQLTVRKQRLTAEYNEKLKEIDAEIARINDAFAVIDDALKPLLCPRCNGDGTIRVCDGAGDMDDEACPDCGGTGIKPSHAR